MSLHLPPAQLELFAVADDEPEDYDDSDPRCETPGCGFSACGPHYDGSPDLCFRHFLPEHGPLRLAAVRAVRGTCSGCGATRPAPDAISRQCQHCGADADAGRLTETLRVTPGVL